MRTRMLVPAVVALGLFTPAPAADQPNVLVVISDDLGFGDLGVHGNPVVNTPNLDRFAKQGAWLKNFSVSPVCSPTRSALLTGLYNYRTGVVDTFVGRSLMRPEIATLPQLLAAAGYRTGIFGKWHLGDNYPLRPEDRGFGTTLWHRGGGLAQPSDPPEVDPAKAYFDPVLVQNGTEVKTKGYCTDVFTDAAVEFVTAEAKAPFFAYVAYNAPHAPYQVPEVFAERYRKLDLTAEGFPKLGQPWATKKLNTEDVARAYGMIENVDTNFGRLLKALDDAKLAKNTVVIFLTDNGPGGVRFNAGLRNRKGTVYEGGIRVPCYVRWPGRIKPGTEEETPLAHIDVTPSILDACRENARGRCDGRSFLPLLAVPGGWADRTLFFQWHRGDKPEKFRAFAARGPRYKLVQAAGVPQGKDFTPKYELFDIANDPFEQTDLAAKLPGEVAKLKKEYETWFADVTKKGFDPPRIVIGSEKENPVRLSRQDWRGEKAGWGPENLGHWEVQFERAGTYELTVRSRNEFDAFSIGWMAPDRKTEQGVGGKLIQADPMPVRVYSTRTTIDSGPNRIDASVALNRKSWGVDYLELKYLGPKK